MRNISFQTDAGKIDLEASDLLVRRVASRYAIPESSVTDVMILRFFQEVSDFAFKRADHEYIESNGTNT